MSAGEIIAIISVCAVVTGGLLGIIFSMFTIEQVECGRQVRSTDSSFPFLRWASLQTLREYRNSCPNGKLHIYTLAAYGLSAIGFIGFAVFMVIAYQPLVVGITSPANGAVFFAPANIVISANANEGHYGVSRVDFYQGSTLIGSSTTAPHSVTWSNVAAGDYSLTAKAIDDRGTTATSDAVGITVNAPGRAAPLR
jgi:hypothetical protein